MDTKRTKHWRSGPPSTSPGGEVLSHLYLEEKLSIHGIAKRYGVASPTVARWLRNAGIQTRSISEGTSLAQMGKPLSEKGRAASASKLEKARAARTPESFEKWRQKMKGRTPPNKGVPWSPEQREKQMAIRTTPEYRKAASERQRGEKAHNWKGGVSGDEVCRMQRFEWRQRRLECYERDLWTCQDCGVKCLNAKDARRVDTKRKIQAHHIVRRRDGGSDDLSNLTTLCMSCHQKREWRYHNALFA